MCVSVGPLGYPPKQMGWCGKHLVRGRTIGYHFGIAIFPAIFGKEDGDRYSAPLVTANECVCRRLDVFENDEGLLINPELRNDAERYARVKDHAITPDKCPRNQVFIWTLKVISNCSITICEPMNQPTHVRQAVIETTWRCAVASFQDNPNTFDRRNFHWNTP